MVAARVRYGTCDKWWFKTRSPEDVPKQNNISFSSFCCVCFTQLLFQFYYFQFVCVSVVVVMSYTSGGFTITITQPRLIALVYDDTENDMFEFLLSLLRHLFLLLSRNSWSRCLISASMKFYWNHTPSPFGVFVGQSNGMKSFIILVDSSYRSNVFVVPFRIWWDEREFVVCWTIVPKSITKQFIFMPHEFLFSRWPHCQGTAMDDELFCYN